MLRSLIHRPAGEGATLPDEGALAPFTRANAWLNSPPLTPDGLRGRVVAVDFWTYTCVNWLRTLPYVRAWASKYRAAGLTVVGVHTPEFGFEHDFGQRDRRCRTALASTGRSQSTTTTAYGRPSTITIGRRCISPMPGGRIRYQHFGEGEYAMSEMVIQQLLAEAGAADVDRELVNVDPQGLEVAADWRTLQSPETYVGYGQASGFAQEASARFDSPADYTAAALRLNEWALSGNWTVARHAGLANRAGARIAFRFHARDVNLVMGPADRGRASHSAYCSMVRRWARPPALMPGRTGAGCSTSSGRIS